MTTLSRTGDMGGMANGADGGGIVRASNVSPAAKRRITLCRRSGGGGC